jgi:hypothetical protein
MDTSYNERNQAETGRLASLAARLTAEDLDRSLGDGWTVKAALAHLAFWDRYAVAVLDGWAESGFQPVTTSVEHINAAALVGWLALPSAQVLREVVAAATAADLAAAAVSPELAAAIEAGGRARIFQRSLPRAAHLEQIASVLGA